MSTVHPSSLFHNLGAAVMRVMVFVHPMPLGPVSRLTAPCSNNFLLVCSDLGPRDMSATVMVMAWHRSPAIADDDCVVTSTEAHLARCFEGLRVVDGSEGCAECAGLKEGCIF